MEKPFNLKPFKLWGPWPLWLLRLCCKVTRQFTNKGCALSLTSSEMLSSDHEQLTESKKGAGHCESNNLVLGKIQACLYNDVTAS